MKRLLIKLTVVCVVAKATSAGAFCFEEAGRTYNLSPDLLISISKHESNFKPDAVGWNTNGTYDFGPMQINSSWAPTLKKHGIKWSSLADPCTNVKVGAWILSQCFAKYGPTWEAVGCYNSQTPSKRDAYARKVANVYKQMDKKKLRLQVPIVTDQPAEDKEPISVVWADKNLIWEKTKDALP